MTLPPIAASATLEKESVDPLVKSAAGEIVVGHTKYWMRAVIEGRQIFVTLHAPRKVWSE